MNRTALVVSSCLFTLLSACGGGGGRRAPVQVPPPPPRPVSILVEVYDPVTNFVWQDVSVRVVESFQEWSGVIYPSPFFDIYLTDATGRVFLDEYQLAFVEVGFVEDGNDRAMLSSDLAQDEAVVTLEISGAGFVTVYVDVPLSWNQPDVFVEVPFN
ncbi:MAG: hypothetical protein ACK501_11595 [Planctomycetota bacterium]|jgi:hypothetical protein